VLSLILVAMAVSMVALLVVAAAIGPGPSVPADAALYLRVRAPLNEIEPSDVLSQFTEPPPTLRATVAMIRRAKTDRRIRHLVLLPQTAGGFWAQLQEIRDAIVDFRTSGKPVTAYLEYGGAREYYLASAADRILMMPAGRLDLAGLATYELFFRGALDKLGVYPDLVHIGEYKTASNTFTEQTFTPAHREATESLNRSWYDEIVQAVAESRGLSEENVRGIIDGGPYLAEAAVTAGLVDELRYKDQIDDADPAGTRRRIDGDTYARLSGGSASGPRIALLYAVGTIASGSSAVDAFGGRVLGSDTFAEWVRRVRTDEDIRAIVVRIDSPGGSAIASEVMWRELMLAREAKPVVVSMGDVAASGGYYIAAPAHAIVAEPGTITGSIGVVTGKYVLDEAMDVLGVGTGVASDGRFAEMYSPFRQFTPEERGRVESQMRTTYELFLARVAEGRQTSAEQIDIVAQGRVWTGRQAYERGLVDELGGLDRAIEIARERANLDPSRGVRLVVYPARRSLFEVLANPFGASMSVSLDRFLSRPGAGLVEAAVSRLGRFRPGEPLALMPNLFWP
jgi:protease-4